MEFTLKQAKNLLEIFGGKESQVTVTRPAVGEGLIAYHTEYPEEGSVEL